MSDPVNSSDEAVEAAWQELSAAMRQATDTLAIERARRYFAAAVRTEAVADERRRIDGLLRQVDLDAAIQGNWSVGKYAKAVRDVRDSLAAGSVPVATPPAAPACKGFTIRERPDHQPLGPCLHCGKTYQQHRAPSQPVTCEHGETGRHALTRTNHPLPGCFTTTWCPGPVSVPKESSE